MVNMNSWQVIRGRVARGNLVVAGMALWRCLLCPWWYLVVSMTVLGLCLGRSSIVSMIVLGLYLWWSLVCVYDGPWFVSMLVLDCGCGNAGVKRQGCSYDRAMIALTWRSEESAVMVQGCGCDGARMTVVWRFLFDFISGFLLSLSRIFIFPFLFSQWRFPFANVLYLSIFTPFFDGEY